MLEGYRTKITGWVMAIIPILAMVGIQVDPVAVTQFINDFSAWIGAGYALGGYAVHYFRNLAK